MNKPIIGISTSQLVERDGTKRNYVNQEYIEAVIKNGAVPILIPYTENKESIKDQINIIDGLILSGGHDVFPKLYNEPCLNKLSDIFPERDEFDKELYLQAKNKKIPILAICRGMQLINVIEGGSLYQDLENITDIKHVNPNYTQRTQQIEIKKGSKLEKYFGSTEYVNTFHHQALKNVASCFDITSRSIPDGIVESIEHKEYEYIVGVQFHPEVLINSFDKANLLFKDFIIKSIKCKV